jgi:hypothetical protein
MVNPSAHEIELQSCGNTSVDSSSSLWNSLVILLDLLRTVVRTFPGNVAQDELHREAVGFFERLVDALSPVPAKLTATNNNSNVRLGTAAVPRGPSQPTFVHGRLRHRASSASRRVPHAAVATFVKHLLDVGELRAAAGAILRLHASENIALAHYNAALLEKAASAAKLVGLSYEKIVALVRQRRVAFGPDVLEPEIISCRADNDSSSVGLRDGDMLCGNIACGSVFTNWRFFDSADHNTFDRRATAR